MRSLFICVVSSVVATGVFWTLFAACVDQPVPPSPPQSRLVGTWDPLGCGDPHRIAVELEDDDGAPLSTSVPCDHGSFTLDIPHFGIYRGRVYAWTLGQANHTLVPLTISIDQPIVELPVTML
ncbi:MAG TPA: hypothetical protein VGO00_00380 [Kofleriaceae bacterium]|jgi:hypothetical protein|nr:hypothetical protein [Kofleriaceae bacterium]